MEGGSQEGKLPGINPSQNRQSRVLYGLGERHNPYAKYATSDDGDSVDDGIHLGKLPLGVEYFDNQHVRTPMP